MSGSTSLEKALKEQYVPIFQNMMGLSRVKARQTFEQLYARVLKDAEKEDTLSLPARLGDFLLERESADKKVSEVLAKKRKEGVKDEDIRWWWNMPDLARRMMVKVDEVFLYSMYLKFTKEEGLAPEDANEKLRRVRPVFGNPDDVSYAKGQDRPLPDELRDKVNKFFLEKGQKDPDGLKDGAEACTSFNAYIRKELKAGNI